MDGYNLALIAMNIPAAKSFIKEKKYAKQFTNLIFHYVQNVAESLEKIQTKT